MSDFIKLKDLVGKSFTVQTVGSPRYKMWSNADSRMITSDTPQEGFRKLYPTTTDKGIVDLGSGQIGSLLEATLTNGHADLNGQTFEVRSNGKEGIDIRYYFNLTVGEPERVSGSSATGAVSGEQQPADLPPIESYGEPF